METGVNDLRPVALIVLWSVCVITLCVIAGCAHNDGMGDLYKGVGRV
jgi:hypothetical protein